MALEPGTQVETEDRRGQKPVARGLAFSALTFAALISAAFVVACAPTAAQKAEADMASIRKESDAKTLVERGKGFAAIGDPTRAEEYLASGIEAGADPRDVLPLLIDVCVKTGRYRSAIQHGENQLRKHPHDMRTRVVVGALYAAINESKQARQVLEHVVADARDAEVPPPPVPPSLRAQAHYLLAVVARDGENDVVDADRHFREYLRIEPGGAHAEEAKASLLKQVQPEDHVQPAEENDARPENEGDTP